ncbi:MAG: class I SAM-dependent methyltransferase, partial [Lapillicoccus sp.]
MATDWVAWHAAYGDPESSLSRRLDVVQAEIGRWLDLTAPRRVGVVSVCAGDGRDLVGALAGRSDASRVRATLVELDPVLCRQARAAAAAAGLPGVEVRQADAGTPESYAGCPPADLLLVCGVFGNVSDTDVEGTIG